jgi:hypothetical protein
MANDLSYLNGIQPRMAEIVQAQAELFSDRVLVYIDNANVTEAANDTWSKVVNFRLIGETSGLVLPYTGTVGAAVTNTTGSDHSPTVSSATPTVTMGSGSVTVAHGGTGYTAADKQTLTITYTNLRGSTDTDTWTITMS